MRPRIVLVEVPYQPVDREAFTIAVEVWRSMYADAHCS
jgi:hypothetical protein